MVFIYVHIFWIVEFGDSIYLLEDGSTLVFAHNTDGTLSGVYFRNLDNGEEFSYQVDWFGGGENGRRIVLRRILEYIQDNL